jgi:hypothetical protein
LGVVDIGSGVHTSSLRILFGVVNTLNLGVPLVNSVGGDVHDLMEHGHSHLSLHSLREGIGTESDVSAGFSVSCCFMSRHESADIFHTT